MAGESASLERLLFSIGHSNHAMDDFLALLGKYQIKILADVRSQPYSKYASHFDIDSLRQVVTAAGIRYVFLGKELGGRPADDACYDEEGHVLYGRVAQASSFREGIRRLENGVAKFRVAMMCSEEDPAGCHRHLLVGRVLTQRGIEIAHIRGDGRLQPDAEFGESNAKEQQLTLFGEPLAVPWRSLRPVQRRQNQTIPLDD